MPIIGMLMASAPCTCFMLIIGLSEPDVGFGTAERALRIVEGGVVRGGASLCVVVVVPWVRHKERVRDLTVGIRDWKLQLATDYIWHFLRGVVR